MPLNRIFMSEGWICVGKGKGRWRRALVGGRSADPRKAGNNSYEKDASLNNIQYRPSSIGACGFSEVMTS
jgi:hypothetical protein